ncbi:hypothetical protein [Tropicibacter sp. S64]|uniref:hypothetical protein n=1 Tax=Tropicibacter sp. S64 TaxID=3415122 RepID=UPI003C7A7805
MLKARDIYQAALDGMTQAMHDRDSPAFLRYIRLPQTMTTVDGSMTFSTAEALTESFLRYMRELASRGVDRIERRCIAARIDILGVLDGHHITRLFRGDMLAREPYTTQMRFEQQADGRWLNFLSETSMTTQAWPVLPEEARSTPPMGIDAQDFEAFGIFQGLVNTVTQHYLTGDVLGLHAVIDYPITMHSRKGESQFSSFEEMKADFELYMNEFKIHGVTDVVRNVKAARYITPTTIKGRYKTFVLNRDRMIVDPYESEMTLVKHADGSWRMQAIRHGLGHLNWHRTAAQ